MLRGLGRGGGFALRFNGWGDGRGFSVFWGTTAARNNLRNQLFFDHLGVFEVKSRPPFGIAVAVEVEKDHRVFPLGHEVDAGDFSVPVENRDVVRQMPGTIRGDDGPGLLRVDLCFANRLALVFDLEPHGVVAFEENGLVVVLEALPVQDLIETPFLRRARGA